MSNWIVPPEQVSVDDEAPLGGRRGSQTTFKGTWNGMVVAVKRLPQDSSRQVILDHVQRYSSPASSNVLQVLGASSEAADPPYILSPFLMNGCITDFLERYPGASRPKAVAEVALGMEYLHSMNVDHGRLKTSNVLVTDNGQACIVDQGLYTLANMPSSSYCFLSPEAWKGVMSQPSDVYSFAMILTSVSPWGYLSEEKVFKFVVKLEERPERRPSNAALPITDREWQTLEEAWHADPDARLTFKQIVARLNARAFANDGREPSGSFLLARETRTPAPDTNYNNSSSFPSRRLPIPQAELEANTRPLNIHTPPAPPAYVPSDNITTFRPSPSVPAEKNSLRSSPEVVPSRASQRSPSGQWSGSASNQQHDSRSYVPLSYNGQNQQQQQQLRPPSSASSSSSGFYGPQVSGRPPLPPESPPTDHSSLASGFPGTRRRDTVSTHRSMDYLTRQYSTFMESPGILSSALPSSPMLNHPGLEVSRAPTAFSTASSSVTPPSQHNWRPPTAGSFGSSQSPGPGSSYQHERFNTGFSSSGGTTPASAQSYQTQYFNNAVMPPLNELEFQPSPEPTPQEPFFQPSTRRFSQVDFGWQTVFDSNNHRIPVYAETWFKKDWEVVEIHEHHCLFRRKLTDKHLLNVLTMKTKKLTMFDLKSEPMAVGLSHDGRFLISSLKSSLTIIDVQTHKVSKRANNSGVRQWTSNRQEFCWVDREGFFWVWSFAGEDQPRQVFRLKSSAPSASMRPITSADGTWYAICATDRDRMSGVVHCYPANNEPALVFDGVSAGFMQVAGADGMNVQALATLKSGAEGGRHFFEMQVHHLEQTRVATQPRRYPNEAVGKSLPRLWDDPDHSMVVAAVATRSDGYSAYVFDSATGDLLCTHPINEEGYDRVYCSAGGLFMEKEGRAIKRLQLHPGGLVLDTSPMVQSPTMTIQSEPLSSPSTATLPQPPPLPPKEYGRADTSGFSDTSSTKKKTGGWKGMFKSISGSSHRGDRIVSSSQGSKKTQGHAFGSFGQAVGEDENWIYQKR
ncbi:hypothetical protein FRB97_009324 [Tulasnella sp. 331]|nr:hypothetical protein FRB97_009324 [Tulasnella sp. 331]